jgi:hypothetical protein
MAQFFEGLLYGILNEQYTDLHECLGDVGIVQNDMYLAVHDFEQ